jgi:hypothetical protein
VVIGSLLTGIYLQHNYMKVLEQQRNDFYFYYQEASESYNACVEYSAGLLDKLEDEFVCSCI